MTDGRLKREYFSLVEDMKELPNTMLAGFTAEVIKECHRRGNVFKPDGITRLSNEIQRLGKEK